MRSFKYRTPRFSSSAELTFHIADATMEGVCMDLSQDGVLAVFEEDRQEVGAVGWILLRYSDREFSLSVVVTHQEDKHTGLSFLRRTREERAAVEQFAAFLELQKKDSLLRSAS